MRFGPSTVPGAEIKLNTALKRFWCVGLDMALSNIFASLASSTDQHMRTRSFQLEGLKVGILRALTIIFVRKGSSSSKSGTCVKPGATIVSGGGVDTKLAVGSTFATSGVLAWVVCRGRTFGVGGVGEGSGRGRLLEVKKLDA